MVNGQGVAISYLSDAVTTVFAYPNYFFNPSDLMVTLADQSGNVTTLEYGSDYTISGTPDGFGAYSSGGNVVLTVAPGAGCAVTITRITQRTQLITYPDYGPFPATAHEAALDKLTLIAQEVVQTFLGVADGPPTSGSFLVGQWFQSRTPTPGGNFGWVCTAAGRPGKWIPFGLLSL